MSTEKSDHEETYLTSQRLCFRAVAEADPGALIRVLQLFQHLNIVPRCVIAEATTTDRLHIEVHVTSLSEERLSLIVAKTGQMPSILNVYWYHL
jgi:hypothetical protein